MFHSFFIFFSCGHDRLQVELEFFFYIFINSLNEICHQNKKKKEQGEKLAIIVRLTVLVLSICSTKDPSLKFMICSQFFVPFTFTINFARTCSQRNYFHKLPIEESAFAIWKQTLAFNEINRFAYQISSFNHKDGQPPTELGIHLCLIGFFFFS